MKNHGYNWLTSCDLKRFKVIFLYPPPPPSRSFLNPSLVNVTNVRDTKLILFEIKSINWASQTFTDLKTVLWNCIGERIYHSTTKGVILAGEVYFGEFSYLQSSVTPSNTSSPYEMFCWIFPFYHVWRIK